MAFLEIGTDKDHVHFLIQSIPPYSPTKSSEPSRALPPGRSFPEYPKSKSTSGVESSGRTDTTSAPSVAMEVKEKSNAISQPRDGRKNTSRYTRSNSNSSEAVCIHRIPRSLLRGSSFDDGRRCCRYIVCFVKLKGIK